MADGPSRVQALSAVALSTVAAREGRKRAENLAAVESQIADLERLLEDHGRRLQDEGVVQSYEEVARLSREYAATQERLDTLMEQWTELAAEA